LYPLSELQAKVFLTVLILKKDKNYFRFYFVRRKKGFTFAAANTISVKSS